MLWFLLAFGSAVTHAALGLLDKKRLRELNPFALGAGSFTVSGLLALAVSLAVGLPTLGARFLPVAVASTLFSVLAMTFYYNALKAGDISLSAPMLSFTPAFLLVASPLVLNEWPSAAGVFGVLLVAAGAYVLNVGSAKRGLLEPFLALVKSEGSRLMLATAFLFTFTAVVDKLLVAESDFLLATASLGLGTGACFWVLAAWKGVAGQARDNLFKTAKNGVLQTVSITLLFSAYALAIVPYAIAVRRLSILFAVAGGGLLFKEKGLKRRLAASAVMVAGAVFILLG